MEIIPKNTFKALHSASRDGLLEAVITLVENGADIEERNDAIDTPLLLAAANKHEDIVEYLINAGADINCSGDQKNYTVLHYVSRNGWLEILQSLVNKGADIQAKTDSGNTPLLMAAHYNHTHIVKFLINAGADINCSGSWDNYTVLHYASNEGWLDIVLSVLNKGADIHVKTEYGESPLLLAAQNMHADIVEHLINEGADINWSGGWGNYTVMHCASENGWLEIVQSLLKKGADIQVKTKHGETPLLLAAKNTKKYIVEFLINAGADVNYRCGYTNYTVLLYAAENGWFKIVQSLINKGADIQVKTEHGESPLLLAAQNRHTGIVELLINAGAELNCSSCWNNNTVLLYASEYGWLEIVQSLINKGADIEVKNDDSESPLLLAARNRHKGIVELLINSGADINCSCTWNRAVLHLASSEGWLEITQSLLKKGVNINAKTVWGDSSLHIACNHNRIEIVEHLINAGADVNAECNGKSALGWLIGASPDLKLVRLLFKSGAYLKSIYYERILRNSLLKEHILQDINLCSQAIINEFNHKDLPELYKLPMASKILPRIDTMSIGDVTSQVTSEVIQRVKNEIEAKGHCNLFKARPIVLKMLAVKSFLVYCDSIKTKCLK